VVLVGVLSVRMSRELGVTLAMIERTDMAELCCGLGHVRAEHE
jgi:hypothetical protein